MIRTTNTDCRKYVVAREPFTASNIFGVKGRDTYVVYSYGHHFPMYAFINGRWHGNSDKYSATTTRHQSLARPVHRGSDMQWHSTAELERLIHSASR